MLVDLSQNSKNYCGTWPLSVRCFNKSEIEVSSWDSVLVEVCRGLYTQNTIRFEKATRTETFRHVILHTSQTMNKPVMFVAGHYVETDFNESEVLDWIKRLIDRLGIATEAVVISVTNDPHEISHKKVESISSEKVEDISLEKVESVSPEKVEDISLKKVENISPKKVENISPKKVENISPKKVEIVETAHHETFSASVVQQEPNPGDSLDLDESIANDFNLSNGVLRFGKLTDFEQFELTRPENLFIYSNIVHFDSARDFVYYQFESWFDIIERVLVLFSQLQPDKVIVCLKNYCSASVNHALSESKNGMKKPLLLHDQYYIDLHVFENNAPLSVECICLLCRILDIKSEEFIIHYRIDENAVEAYHIINSMKSSGDPSKDAQTPVIYSSIKSDQLNSAHQEDQSCDLNPILIALAHSEMSENRNESDDEDESSKDELDNPELDQDSNEDEEESILSESEEDDSEEDEEAEKDDSEDDSEEDDDSEDDSEEEPEKEPVMKPVYYQFSLAKNYALWADGTPTALHWRGDEISVDSWPELFEEFCEKMLDDCEEQFIEILTNSELVVENKEELRLPYRIRGEELYIETDRPAARMMKLMEILCSECNIPKDEVEIETTEWEEVTDEDDSDEDEDSDENEYNDIDDEDEDVDEDDEYDDEYDEDSDDDEYDEDSDDDEYDEDSDDEYDEDSDDEYDEDSDDEYDEDSDDDEYDEYSEDDEYDDDDEDSDDEDSDDDELDDDEEDIDEDDEYDDDDDDDDSDDDEDEWD